MSIKTKSYLVLCKFHVKKTEKGFFRRPTAARNSTRTVYKEKNTLMVKKFINLTAKHWQNKTIS